MIDFEKVGKKEWCIQESQKLVDVMNELNDAADLFEAGHLEKTMKLCRHIVSEVPECIEAYNYLSLCHKYMDNYFEALSVLETAVNIFLPYFPEPLMMNKDHLLWGFLENRPFMRVYGNLGMMYMEMGRYKEAKIIFDHLLAWNPNDNQGNRECALACNLELGLLDDALEVCRHYPEDMLPGISYGLPLVLCMQNQIAKAKNYLAAAIKRQPKVAKELLKSKHKPPQSLNEGYITVGGDDEAYVYWQRFGEYWDKSEAAKLLLKELVQS